MAQRMGLGEEALSGYPDEKSGNLMTARQSAGAAIANLAIGQGETLMTPLQAARMTNIIASDGVESGGTSCPGRRGSGRWDSVGFRIR